MRAHQEIFQDVQELTAIYNASIFDYQFALIEYKLSRVEVNCEQFRAESLFT